MSEQEIIDVIARAQLYKHHEPIPLTREVDKQEQYPVHAMGILAPIVEAIARQNQVPISMAAQSVLAVASLATQSHVDVSLPFGQRKPTSLFFVTIAESGDRKTSSDHEAMRGVHRHEAMLQEKHNLEFSDWQHACTAWKIKKTKIEAAAKSKDYSAIKNELKSLGSEPKKPTLPFRIIADLTYDGLTRALECSHPSLGIFTNEGGMFLSGHSMNEDNRVRTASALSEAWDGKSIKRMRAADGVSIYPGRRICVHLMVQRTIATDFIADNVMRGQGILSRILMSAPDSLGDRFYKEPRNEDILTINRFEEKIFSLLESRSQVGPHGELTPRTLRCSADAKECWIAFHDNIERQISPDREMAEYRDIGSKAAEQAARIAAIFQFIEDPAVDQISIDAMANATELMNWYLKEADRIISGFNTPPDITEAQKLLKFITNECLKKGCNQLSVSQIMQMGPRSLRHKKPLDRAIRTLVEHHYLGPPEGSPKMITVLTVAP